MIFLFLSVKVKYVHIQPANSSSIAVIENVPEPVVCLTSETRPNYTIKWTRNDISIYDCDTTDTVLTKNKLYVTKCTSMFTINRQNGSWTLWCSALNVAGSSLEETNSSKTFFVLCKYNLKFNNNKINILLTTRIHLN